MRKKYGKRCEKSDTGSHKKSQERENEIKYVQNEI